ncbi:MAG: hypothetical protein OER96_07390 [Gammaproteobacteria bacterium]|nr:hypothetical protein [Gammaproteobacteria bacterium]
MTRLIKSSMAILLSLVTVVLHADARVESMAIETRLKDAVVGLYDAIAENRLEQAMRFYHSDAPEVARIRAEIEHSQSAYLQKTTTLSFHCLGQRNHIAFAKARHRFLRIAGIKFLEKFAEVSYEFRKEGPTWKLWMTQVLQDSETM